MSSDNMTALQKAAQAAIVHANEFYALYKRTVTIGCIPLDELKFVATQKELRKALDAEIAMPVEPVGYFRSNPAGDFRYQVSLTSGCQDSVPLYVHPPQPQAATPVSEVNWLIRKEPNTKDTYFVAEGNPPEHVLEIYGITQGEKP